MRTFYRALRSISAVTLFFFVWSFLPLWQAIAYAAEPEGQGTRGQGSGSRVQGSARPEERFEKALDAIRENVFRAGGKAVKGEDDTREQDAIKAKRADIDSADVEFKKEFSATEKKLKDAKLPKEILDRHANFVKHYEDNLNELRVNLDSVEQAISQTDRKAKIEKTRLHLETVKAASKHDKLDPNKMSFRKIKGKDRTPRLKQEEFEKAFPSKRKIRTASILQDRLAADSRRSTQILGSGFKSAMYRKPILLAYNGPVSDVPLQLPLPSGERTEVRGVFNPQWSQTTMSEIRNPQWDLAQAQDTPTAADLAETTEIQFTDAIRAKAQELGGNPVRIYEYVRNNIEFTPTYGSIQGADGCLATKSCNAYDTSSLLIALLRASNISSRYVYGTIEVPADRFMDWAGGFTDIQSAIRFVSSSGTPIAPVFTGNVISKVQLEHPWVEAWIDYNPSRGERHVTGDTWIPLDASYKQHASKDGVDIAASVSLDSQSFLQALGAGTTADETAGSVLGGTCAASGQLMENYRVLAGNFLSQQHPNSSVGDVLGGSAITKQEFPYLLGTLPYRVYTAGVKSSEMPDSLRNSISLRLMDAGVASIDVTRGLPELAGKQISIGFVPATQADQDTILRYLPLGSGAIDLASLPSTLPAYLINVKPELRIDGIAVATGASIGLGKAMTLDMTLTTPGLGADNATRSINAGDYAVIMLETGVTASERLNTIKTSLDNTKAKLLSGAATYTREDIIGNQLRATGLAYAAELAVKRGILERSFNVRTMMQPSVLLASSTLDTTQVFGLPHTARGKGTSLELIRDNAAASRSGDLAVEKQFNITASLDASVLTSRVLDDLLGSSSATGAVRALQTAKGTGIPIHTINQANIVSALPLLTLDAETLSDIQNAVNAGLTVVTTRTSIAVSNKIVTPLVLIDPLDGKSAWLLENGLNGSMSAPAWSVQSPMMNLVWTGILPRLAPLSQSYLSDDFATNFDAAVNGVAFFNDSVAGSSLGLLTQGIFYSAASTDLDCYLASSPAAPTGSCMASFSGSLCMADASSLGTVNAKPLANAGSSRNVAVNSLVTLDGSNSSDQNNDPLTYAWTMTAKPTGSSAVLTSGSSISPAFTADLPGSYVVTLTVSDGKSFSAPAQVTITAAHSSVPTPNLSGKTQQEAEALIIASHLSVGAISDSASDTVSIGKVLSQDPAPNVQAVKGSAVKIILSTGPATDKEPPVLSAVLDRTPSAYNSGDPALLFIEAKDESGPVTITMLVEGQTTTIVPPTATIDTTGFAPGSNHAIEVTATDQANNKATATLYLGIKDPALTTGPEIAITAPALDAEISAPTAITGTVTTPNLLQYTLSYAEAGSTSFTDFALGASLVTNGTLGTLDPTLMKNGIYTIRLTAIDTNGMRAWIDYNYRITGDMKVGNFTVTFTDMSIPVAGLPVTISRTYDSRDKKPGDFGIGWTADMQSVKVDENRIPGEGWKQNSSGVGFKTYCLDGQGEHYVTVALPDGRTEEFDVTYSPTCQKYAPIQYPTMGFTARPGTTSKLRLFETEPLLVVNGQVLDPDTGMPYDPSWYILTTQDGSQYLLDQTFGIRSVTDPNGNTITYTKNGVTHSAGAGITFVRDGKGRIAQIKGPDSSMVSYGYNSKDELVSVTDQNGNITTYTYNRSHGLTGIKDPRGITPVKNEYDSSGRLVAHTDSYGKRIEYTHDIAGRQEVVRDRNGNLTVFIYDDKGRVLQKTDPLGSTTSFTYDTVGNKTSETNPLGNTTTWSYDDKKNVLSESKVISGQTITTSHTYNALGKVLTTTDPLGHVTSNTYDAKGNLLTATDALGNTTTNTYDAKGNLKTTTDASNNTTSYEYDGYGNRTKQTNAAGTITYWIYDGKGNKLSETDARGNTTLYSYDASGKLTTAVNAEGAITRTDYDKAGNKVAETNALGIVTWFYYDSANRLVTTEYPDGTTIKTVYDNEGNRTASIDQDGRTTAYEYNGSKQLVKTIYADQTTRQFGYDNAGRQTTITDALGNVTTKVYDALGRVIASIDPELNSTTFEYDLNGNQASQIDPNGHTTTFAYDANNRQISSTLPGGQVTQVAYDELGRKISETDAAGYTTAFGYDTNGNLNKVTDAEGGITRYEYDLNNNRTAIVDARGNRTTFAFDTLNRLASKTMPNGGVETYAYDTAGRQTTKTDAKGYAIQYGYNDIGRLTLRSYPNGSTVVFSYTNTGKRLSVIDQRGTTSYAYDGMNRLKTNTYPDGNAINYGYDATGRIAALSSNLTGTISYIYTNGGRLKEVRDPQGRVTAYSYDPAGSRTGLAYPNGANTSYIYDNNNRLTNLTHKNSVADVLASYTYTLGAIGNRTRIDESTGIYRQYQYDRLYRLTKEQIVDPANSQTYQNDFSYDVVGNRLNKTSTSYNQSAVSNDYTYNAADQLLTASGITYSYDLNGNISSKTDSTGTTAYTYDYENRLISVTSPATTVSYQYDADGNRVAVANASGTSKYLVDSNRSLSQVLAEYTTNGTPRASYVYADDLISMNRSGAVSYYHFDGLGSTRLLSDSNGTVTDSYDYDAFGNQLAHTGTTANEFLFTGQQYDANIGFYYQRARYYQPDTGRFTAFDPFAGDPYAPMSLHKYLYAANDPVNRIDPSGEFSLLENRFVQAFTDILNNMYLSAISTITNIATRTILLASAIANMGTRIVYHVTTRASADDILANGVNITKGNGRMGKGFYVAVKESTAWAEVMARRTGTLALQVTVRFKKVLDLTNSRIKQVYDYNGSNGPAVAQRAKDEGYDAIKYVSDKVPGEINYIVLKEEAVKVVEQVGK